MANSNKSLDHCHVCGGDGSSCVSTAAVAGSTVAIAVSGAAAAAGAAFGFFRMWKRRGAAGENPFDFRIDAAALKLEENPLFSGSDGFTSNPIFGDVRMR